VQLGLQSLQLVQAFDSRELILEKHGLEVFHLFVALSNFVYEGLTEARTECRLAVLTLLVVTEAGRSICLIIFGP